MDNTERWVAAANRYEEQNIIKAQEEPPEAKAAPVDAQAEERRLFETAVAEATAKINRFLLGGDWLAAKKLLAASREHIVIAEEYSGGGKCVVYFLDAKGLQRSVEPTGTWVAYARAENVPDPEISHVNADEVARLAIRQGADPDQIIESIERRLNAIADRVLQQ